MESFGHENLDVYQASIQFLELAYFIVDQLPKGHATLADQLRRSSLSVPLNIAEGTGKASVNDRSRFYHIARGSALECAAIIDCCSRLKLANRDTLGASRELLLRIVQMTSKLSRNGK